MPERESTSLIGGAGPTYAMTEGALESNQAAIDEDATEGSSICDPLNDIEMVSKPAKEAIGTANSSAPDLKISSSMARGEGEQKTDMHLAGEASPKHDIADSAVVGGADDTDSQASSDDSDADCENNPV